MGIPLIDSMQADELKEFRSYYRNPSKWEADGLVGKARNSVVIVGKIVAYAKAREVSLTAKGKKARDAAEEAEQIYRALPECARFRNDQKTTVSIKKK